MVVRIMNQKLSQVDIEIGRKLAYLRCQLDLTQAEVALEIGVSRTTLVAMEKGQRQVKPAELAQLLVLYRSDDVTLQALVVGENKRQYTARTLNAFFECLPKRLKTVGEVCGEK